MRILFLYCLVVASGALFAQQKKIEFAPSAIPVVFAPNFISDGFENRDMTISPKGDELFFTIQHKAFSVIMYSKKTGSTSSQPQVADFSGRFKDLEASFSAEGNKIFFSSNRPLADT